ncbi:MAG TPA: hypothetical protein VJK02_24835 [Anaerolineales bacterium]|nr:hypothetical protein [Anaerolineales bacterium]
MSMTQVTPEERHWLLRNMAIGLVSHLGVTTPPIWIETLLRHPPAVYADVFGVIDAGPTSWDLATVRPIYEDNRIRIPYDLPLDEHRFALARHTMIVLCGCQYGRLLGLPEFTLKDFWDSQNYFARVLLAPDQLVDAYRRQGKDLRGFAETFLIPPRIATIRWQDPLYL